MPRIIDKDFEELYQERGAYHTASYGYERMFLEANYRLIASSLRRDDNRVLDLGCGEGHIIEYLPENIEYYGIDISPTAIKLAKKQYTGNFYLADMLDMPFDSLYFDAVISSLALQYVAPEGWPDVLSEIARTLKLNGVFTFSHVASEFVGSKYDRSIQSLAENSIDIQTEQEITDALKYVGFEVVAILSTNTSFVYGNYIPILSKMKFYVSRILAKFYKKNSYHKVFVTKKLL